MSGIAIVLGGKYKNFTLSQVEAAIAAINADPSYFGPKLCTVLSTVQGSATPPSGGGVADVAFATSVLWQVSAEIRGTPTPLNDGNALMDGRFVGNVLVVPQFANGLLFGYQDTGVYVLALPFLDELFKGNTRLAPPITPYYLITETYVSETGFGNDLDFPAPRQGEPFIVTRKVRPLLSGGPSQLVSSISV